MCHTNLDPFKNYEFCRKFWKIDSRVLGVTLGGYLEKHSFKSWWAVPNDTLRLQIRLLVVKLLKF